MFYFTSDSHFYDQRNLITNNRPFKSIKSFDNYVIKLWNKQTTKNDTIYFLGDFVSCNGDDGWKKSILYVKRLKAKVVLIIGNNEERIIKYFFDGDFDKFKNYCLNLGFVGVHKNLVINFDNTDFYLVHKPIHYNKNYINLFGHMHRSGGLYKPFGLNIGCDLNHFRLYSQKDIFFMLEMKQKFWDKDKNLNMKI